MKCPVCANDLLMTDRQGIEIDYCPSCRGVWLDRGELDKLIERSMAAATPAADTSRYQEDRRYKDDSRYYEKRKDYYRPKKRKSWLSELLDFD